jgi:hypothetical protein
MQLTKNQKVRILTKKGLSFQKEHKTGKFLSYGWYNKEADLFMDTENTNLVIIATAGNQTWSLFADDIEPMGKR